MTSAGFLDPRALGLAARLRAEGWTVTKPADRAQARRLKKTILSLPLEQREVFLLSRYANLTYEEIAQRLDIAVEEVVARMTQALERCTAAMSG
jgi:RNA polymerase sigma factor (sigma-70 family)